MELSSSAFAAGQAIPQEFTCAGADHAPPLRWRDPPVGTRSFALVIEDPDAPSGTFRHWAAYDIPPDRREMESGASGFSQGINDFGEEEYRGPCPPRGDAPHHYYFRLFALGADRLALGEQPDAEAVLDAAHENALASAELMGTFGR